VEKRSAEEQIHARLRELADDLRELRRELTQNAKKTSRQRALDRKQLPRNPPPPKG
jgi:hypothetical protein